MRNRKDTMATGASSGGTTLISSETTIKGDITFTGQLERRGHDCRIHSGWCGRRGVASRIGRPRVG